ncbi:hypothetical protein M885DRAFT_515473 [Pelagophyceae sp. CCMP2097]|nr:hypothetical protein M885DRAFT_515473 [Pelagophyceae sp. CCMP2097]
MRLVSGLAAAALLSANAETQDGRPRRRMAQASQGAASGETRKGGADIASSGATEAGATEAGVSPARRATATPAVDAPPAARAAARAATRRRAGEAASLSPLPKPALPPALPARPQMLPFDKRPLEPPVVLSRAAVAEKDASEKGERDRLASYHLERAAATAPAGMGLLESVRVILVLCIILVGFGIWKRGWLRKKKAKVAPPHVARELMRHAKRDIIGDSDVWSAADALDDEEWAIAERAPAEQHSPPPRRPRNDSAGKRPQGLTKKARSRSTSSNASSIV